MVSLVVGLCCGRKRKGNVTFIVVMKRVRENYGLLAGHPLRGISSVCV